jgi:predicted MFS family arabinose efflux permease
LFALGGAVAAQAESLYGVIVGRAIQGMGAIAGVIMALLGDVTREEHRAKAMAVIGMSIGLSFSLALVVGPMIAGYVGLSGLFWGTVIMAIVGVGICYWFVPTPTVETLSYQNSKIIHDICKVLKCRELFRVDVGVFLLHLIMTACFIVLPLILVNKLNFSAQQHWLVYLPVLFASFVVMLPIIILAEKYQKIKEAFIFAVFMLMFSLAILSVWYDQWWIFCVALFIYFVAFNLLEAILPSLVSRMAPTGYKGVCMGVFSSAQFFGAFVGGVIGGMVYGFWGEYAVFLMGATLALAWLYLVITMNKPRFLIS